jgi:diacylglycerol kinase (ATP)
MTTPGLLLFNRASGSAENQSPEQWRDLLAARGARVHLREVRPGENPGEIVAEFLTRGISWVAVAGGDGTVEATARALVGRDIPLGIIPVGTYNNFALSAGIPTDPLAACRIIAARNTRTIDVGEVNGRPFFEAVGIGLDAALFPASEEIKSGSLGHVWDLVLQAWRQPRHHLTLELDRPFAMARNAASHSRHTRHLNRRLRVRALLLTISNAPYYGMNFAIAPDARLDDGLLTVSLFKRYGKLELLRHFFAIRAGRRTYAPRLVTLRVQRIRISGRRPAPVHIDGTPASEWPLEISLKTGALTIFEA